MAAKFLTGDKELDRRLMLVGGKIADKAVTSGIRAGLGEIRRAIRAQVPNPSAKKTIASRFKRKRKLGLTVAKVGAGVGPRKQQNAGGSRGSRGGVGISKNNAHWYFLGTSQRTTTNGANRGSMPANNAVALGYARSSSAAMSKVKNKILAVLEREVAKLK